MTFDPATMPMIALNNGQLAPQLGLGVYKIQQDIAVDLVHTAVAAGYRRFDTAALYDNEQEIGAGLRTSGLALNQLALHPGRKQQVIRDLNTTHGIATEAWSPLARGRFNDNELMTKIAAKHGKSVTQVIIRWHIQLENLVIPKSSNPTRLEENINVFDFILDNDDMVAIAALEDGVRIGPNPDDFG